MNYFESIKSARLRACLDRLREDLKAISTWYSDVDDAEIALHSLFTSVFDELRSNRSVRDDELPF